MTSSSYDDVTRLFCMWLAVVQSGVTSSQPVTEAYPVNLVDKCNHSNVLETISAAAISIGLLCTLSANCSVLLFCLL